MDDGTRATLADWARRIDGTALRVLLTMLAHAQPGTDGPRVTITRQRLAAELAIDSPRTIDAAIDRLIEAGALGHRLRTRDGVSYALQTLSAPQSAIRCAVEGPRRSDVQNSALPDVQNSARPVPDEQNFAHHGPQVDRGRASAGRAKTSPSSISGHNVIAPPPHSEQGGEGERAPRTGPERLRLDGLTPEALTEFRALTDPSGAAAITTDGGKRAAVEALVKHGYQAVKSLRLRWQREAERSGGRVTTGALVKRLRDLADTEPEPLPHHMPADTENAEALDALSEAEWWALTERVMSDPRWSAMRKTSPPSVRSQWRRDRAWMQRCAILHREERRKQRMEDGR